MTARRLLLASALALAWCWTAWHEDLEAAGWMFAHEHHHLHHETTPAGEPAHAPGHAAGEGADHQPVWARDLTPEGRLILPLLLATLAMGLGLAAPPAWLRSIPAPSARRRRPPWALDPGWNLPGPGVPAVTGPPRAR